MIVGSVAHASAQVPIGTALYAGPAHQVIGSVGTNSYCQKGHFCYAVPIDEAGPGLSVGSVGFQVVNSKNVPHIVSQNFAKVSLVSVSNSVEAFTQVGKGSPLAFTSWGSLSKGISPATPLSTLITIWIQFGNTKTSPYSQGFGLNVIGVGSFSGVLNVPLP